MSHVKDPPQPWFVVGDGAAFLYRLPNDDTIDFRVEKSSGSHLAGISISRREAETLLFTLAEAILTLRTTGPVTSMIYAGSE